MRPVLLDGDHRRDLGGHGTAAGALSLILYDRRRTWQFRRTAVASNPASLKKHPQPDEAATKEPHTRVAVGAHD